MKSLFTTLFALFVVMLFCIVLMPFCYGDGGDLRAQAKARAALAIAHAMKTDCGCAEGAPCTCGPDCQCVACKGKMSNGGGSRGALPYVVAYTLAVRQQRPLIIWVGETAPALEAEMPAEYVHTHVSSFRGDAGPAVVVAKPGTGDNQGWMVRQNRFAGLPTVGAVAQALESAQPGPLFATPPMQTFQPAPMMAPSFAPAMPMMGGFGGGFGGGMRMGGGGGGGGC